MLDIVKYRSVAAYFGYDSSSTEDRAAFHDQWDAMTKDERLELLTMIHQENYRDSRSE